jgi:hypothetical protein
VLIATIMFCSLATVGCGLWPALRLSRPDLRSSLNDRSGEIGGPIAGRITVRDTLVTAQLALSLALLVASGLFVRGAAAGASANPGFEVGQLAVAEITPARTRLASSRHQRGRTRSRCCSARTPSASCARSSAWRRARRRRCEPGYGRRCTAGRAESARGQPAFVHAARNALMNVVIRWPFTFRVDRLNTHGQITSSAFRASAPLVLVAFHDYNRS